jgi:hypothetical protein
MAKTMKKRFDDGGSVRTRSDDEIGDTDPRTGVVTPGSFDRRRAQGDKNLQSLKNLLGMGSDEPVKETVGSTPTYSDRFPASRAQPKTAPSAPDMPDSSMNQNIRTAIMRQPTGMSPDLVQGQDGSAMPRLGSAPSATLPSSPIASRSKTPPPVVAKPSASNARDMEASVSRGIPSQQSKTISGRGGPTAQELDIYARQKAAQRKSDYEKAQKDAATPEGKAKREAAAEAEAVTPDTDVMSLPIPSAGAAKKAMDLAKGLAKAKKVKSTAPYLKEIGYEPLKVGKEALKVGQKRGGVVKKMASGGFVGNASKRADGIAQRGKTKCKTY